MQPITIVVLACLVAVVAAGVSYEPSPAEQYEAVYESPEYERSARTKRGLLLLKKKLLLGAIGLKVAKVGAGVAGVVALKKGHDKHARQSSHSSSLGHSHPGYVEVHSLNRHPSKYVEVHSWSG